MTRISEKNQRFRTRDEICCDLAFVLNAPVTWGTQLAVVDQALWVWSEFEGKYSGCKHWSTRAWRQRGSKKGLRHDHAVPKAVLRERFVRLRGRATSEEVKRLLEQYCIGVVITAEEDSRLTAQKLRAAMPTGWDETDVFARYSAVRIALRHATPPAV